MKSRLLILLTAITLYLFPGTNFGQAPNLGTTTTFALFTAVGAFDNNGATVVTGDVGSNTFTPTGFPIPGTVNGSVYNASDPITATAAVDVNTLYTDLFGRTSDFVLPVGLAGELLVPGVHSAGAASTLNGDITLDGQGNPDALFIIQINGALTTSTFANVILINSASPNNVFWQINGAFTLGDNSVFVGNVVSAGAIELLEASSLIGRGLTKAGAITLHNNIVTLGAPPAAPTVTLTQPTCILPSGTITITAPTGVGMTYSIDGSDYSNTTGIFSGLAPGSYNVTAMDSDGYVSPITTVTIDAIPLPPAAAGTIVGSALVCEGETGVAYSVPLIANATSYIWTLPAGASIATGANTNSITVDFGATSGNLTVQGSSLCGTGTVSPNFAVTVTPTVTIAAFSPATSTRCQGAGIVTTTTTATNNSAAIVYSLDAVTAAFAGNSINSATGAVTYAALWSGTTTITASAAGCNGPVTTTHVVTVTPSVTIAAFSPATSARCQGAGIVTTTTTATNNSAAIVYSLDAVTAAFAGNSINSATGAVTYAALWSGTTTITASAAGCNGPVTTTHVVTINPTPVAVAGSNSPVTLGGTINLTATAVAGGAYTWSGPNGYSSLVQNPVILSATLTDLGVYSLTVIANTCISAASTTTVSINNADLSVLKTVNNTLPHVGESVIFTIVASNSGPDDATLVNVTDVLQSGYTFVSSTVTAGSYNSVTGVWSIGTMVNGAVETLTITALVDASGIYTNAANIDAPEDDTTPGNDGSTTETFPLANADLGVLKTVNNTLPNVGEQVIFTVVASNFGPSDATLVNVTDVLQSGYTFVSSTATVGAYNSVTGVWAIGTMINGAVETLTITASVDATGIYTNTATIDAPEDDLTPGNDGTTTETFPLANADLGVLKTVNNTLPNVGEQVIFTVVASNFGPSDATLVNVTDVLQSGYTFVSSTATVGAYNSVTGVWAIGTMINGAVETLTITASVDATGIYTNTATIDATEDDLTPGNDGSTTETFPVANADLGVLKTVNNTLPVVGQQVVFTVVATNYGPSDATLVNVTDVLQSGYTFVSSTATVGAYNSVTGIWAIGTMINGAVETLTITAIVDAAGNYVNTATIDGLEDDLTPGNDGSTTETFPVSNADLGVLKTVNNTLPNVGEQVIFTIVATNYGPSDATLVNVTDVLQSGYTFVSSTATVGTYNPLTGVWTIGTMINGASETLTITAVVEAAGNYVNTATIDGLEDDLTPGNDSSTTETFPVGISVADLGVLKTVNITFPIIGESVVFTVVASNNGPADATLVLVTDILESGYTYVSSSATLGSYNPVTGLWTIGTMTNAASETLTITATVNAAGNYVNTASIDGLEDDLNPGNDESTTETFPTDFFIPEGFSPNDDGINDLFVIRGIFNYPENSIVIFNRWGNKVFEANPYTNTWDGKAIMGYRIGGDDLPVGTYFYVLNLGNSSSENNLKEYKGTIYLNR